MIKERQIRKVYMSVVYVWILLSVVSFKAYASADKIEVNIPVIQTFYIESDSPASPIQVGTYELSAENSDFPMPEGSKNGRFEFSLTGNNATSEINILFEKTGIYHYTLKQITEDAEDCSYDRNIYTITVYVVNTPAGQFSSQIVVENGKAGKCAEICFENHYRNDGSPARPPETGDRRTPLFWGLLSLSSFIGCISLTIISRKQIS